MALINPLDAELLDVSAGDPDRIVSEVGEIQTKIRPDASIGKRVIVAPFHFRKLLVNRLTPRVLDPESGTPCYKEVAVRVERI